MIGEAGVNLLSGRLLSHGLSFQRTGALDAGIDGFLELRDPATGEVKAQFISAQLKTRKQGNFSEETNESFGYICEQKDMDYWLQSNLPVILVVARLSDELICWKSIQSWFADPEHRRTRKVVFDKRKDSLTSSALPGFAATVASFATPGKIVPSTRSAEVLNSNLLRVSFPDRIHTAQTTLDYSEIRESLVESDGSPPVDWIVHGKRIFSFRDISMPPFRDVIEEGSEAQRSTATPPGSSAEGISSSRHSAFKVRRREFFRASIDPAVITKTGLLLGPGWNSWHVPSSPRQSGNFR